MEGAEPSIKTAFKEALQTPMRGAVAMGLSWVKISRALVLEHMMTVQILATDTKPEWDALECLWDICAHSRGVRVPNGSSTGNALEMVRVSNP